MSKATITVLRPREELERLWREHEPVNGATFKDAPGDRGTEIHVAVESGGGVLSRLSGNDPMAEAKDALRRFKAQVETGEVPVSAASPEGF
jgi:uncharacterized membrane protein